MTYFRGSAENFFRQWSLQKKYVLPSKSKRRGESSATVIPQMGSMCGIYSTVILPTMPASKWPGSRQP